MRNKNVLRRSRILATAMLIAAGTTACKDDATEYLAPLSSEVQQVNAIKLSIGTQTMTVFKDGKVTLGPLTFARPSAIVTATLLDSQGNVITNVDPSSVRINMGESANSQLTGFNYFRVDDYSGRLEGNTVGTAEFSVSLFDAKNRRAAFGPYFVGVVVR